MEKGTRRKLIVGTVVTAALGKLAYDASRTPQSELSLKEAAPVLTDVYAHWEQFKDGQLPSAIVRAIGRDISNMKQYPGMEEAGRLIVTSQDRPQELANIHPLLARHGPIAVQFSEIVAHYTATAGLVFHFDGPRHPAQLRNRTTGQRHTTLFLFPDTFTVFVADPPALYS